jgi:cation transport ATPase
MKEILLDIEGMHCAACVARVEAELSKVPGVSAAHADLAKNQATVQLESDDAQSGPLLAAVEEAGYQAALADGPRPARDRAELPRYAPSSSGQIDPVCGMTVDPATAAGRHVHDGRTYYFCSRHCVEKFRADPARFLQPGDGNRSVPAVKGGAGPYTCPMHPEIVQDGPGSCPKCGMALEPMQPAAEEGPDPELLDMRRRFWAGAALTAPIFLVAMGGLIPWPALQDWLHGNMAALNWMQLVLATPVVFWCGWPFFQRAWTSVVHRSPSMFTLIALGVGAA